MELCNRIVINALFDLMFSRFEIFIEKALFCNFISMENFVLQEIYEAHVISILEVFGYDLSHLLSLFLIAVKVNVTQFAFNVVFTQIRLNVSGTNLITFSVIQILGITVSHSWILKEDSVVTVAALVNISHVISFHFTKERFENVFALLFCHVFKRHNLSTIIDVINKLVEISASLNHV